MTKIANIAVAKSAKFKPLQSSPLPARVPRRVRPEPKYVPLPKIKQIDEVIDHDHLSRLSSDNLQNSYEVGKTAGASSGLLSDTSADCGAMLQEAAPLVGKLETSNSDEPVSVPIASESIEPKLSPEILDAFQLFHKSQAARRAHSVALATRQILDMRLPYPRQIEGMCAFEELRLMGINSKGRNQLGLTVFEPTGCGKSTLAEQYKLMCNANDAPNQTSVIHARMGTSGTARELFVSIMAEMGDGFASAGNEHSLRRRALREMQDKGVQLLILDETQHSGQKNGFSREVTAELKIMLDTGQVPIILLGTEKAVPIIRADRELSGRMLSPCRLGPLEMTDDDDLELWQGFLNGVDHRMVTGNILSEPMGLDKEELAYALGTACDGVIGHLMRVIMMAVRDVVREQRKIMTIDDLSYAIDEWLIGQNFTRSNPLRDI